MFRYVVPIIVAVTILTNSFIVLVLSHKVSLFELNTFYFNQICLVPENAYKLHSIRFVSFTVTHSYRFLNELLDF